MKGLYFAYGSNLKRSQMKFRCPAARPLCRAYLPDYLLEFKSNGRGSGVASIRFARGAYVEGVLYKVTAVCLNNLDRYEGHPYVYQRQPVKVFSYDHTEYRAVTYVMNRRFVPAEPSREYLCRIQDGYVDFGIPFDTLVEAYEESLGGGHDVDLPILF